jgi:hypothetical protein
VFCELASEIEAQGVGRKVAADMFGMALRTYQKRVQRLRESQSFRERTLWEAILQFIESTGSVTRTQIDKRFARDPDEQRGAVLLDLIQSGLVYNTGRGEQAIYGPTTDADRRAMRGSAEFEALANLAWLALYQSGPLSLAQLSEHLECSVERALGVAVQLRDSGRLEVSNSANEPSGWPTDPVQAPAAEPQPITPSTLLRTHNLTIAAAEAAGWEAAFLDHFRAMATALANKVRLGVSQSTPGVGGATYTFNLHSEHPLEPQVSALFQQLREQVDTLWYAVSEYNREHALPENHKKVTLYLGQNVVADLEENNEEVA